MTRFLIFVTDRNIDVGIVFVGRKRQITTAQYFIYVKVREIELLQGIFPLIFW